MPTRLFLEHFNEDMYAYNFNQIITMNLGMYKVDIKAIHHK